MLHYQLSHDMKHLFKELLFKELKMFTISKLTAHVLKHVAKPLQKHGGLHG